MIKITEQRKNHINSKKQFVVAYANGGVDNTTWRDDVFKIKSFLSGDREKDKILYIKNNYFRLISNKFADFEIGNGISVQFSKKNINEKLIQRMDSTNFMKNLHKLTIQKSKVGYSIVRVRYINEQIKIENIPVTNYFCKINDQNFSNDVNDITEHNILSFVKKEQESGRFERVAYIDNYKKTPDNKRIGTYGQYSYNPRMKYDLTNAITEPIIEILDYLPIFVFNNDIYNDDMLDLEDLSGGNSLINNFFGQSDYVDIIDLCQDINDRQSQISVELIKHLGSKLSLPRSFFEDRKRANLSKIMKNTDPYMEADLLNKDIENFDYLSHGDGEQLASYITKDPSMIDRAEKQIEKNIRAISCLTSVPIFMFGLEAPSGNRHVGTDLKDMEGFLKRIEQKRETTYNTYQHLFAYITYLLGFAYELPTIKYSKLPNTDLDTKVKIAESMKENKFLSQESLIKFVNNFDQQEYEEEKKLLDKEEEIEQAINPTIDLDFNKNINVEDTK